MRARVVVMILSVLFLIGFAAPVGRTSTAEKMRFTSTEHYDPFGLLGDPVGSFVSAGTVMCPGFEPTGNPMMPCPAGSRIHFRGAIWVSRAVSSSPLASGMMTIVANGNWDADYAGPIWGTFSIVLDGSAGTWDGTWEGRRFRDEAGWSGMLHGIGMGTDGNVDGMQMMVSERLRTPLPMPIAYSGVIEGRMLDPHAK